MAASLDTEGKVGTQGGERAAAQSQGVPGEDSTSKEPQQRHSSLIHTAAVTGDKSLLSKLLAADVDGKDREAADHYGRTPLVYSVLGDRIDCAKLLLKKGCKVDTKDEQGRTALHWAAHRGHSRCVKLLLSKGANWKDKDNGGATALHLATRHRSAKCLRLLIKRLGPGEIDGQDKNKRTPLHWAASFGNVEHTKILIKQDSNIGIPDIEGRTPLHWAAAVEGSIGLTSSGASEGAAAQDTAGCVRLLLAALPSVINWQDYEGRTALHVAAASGNLAVVNVLVSSAGCNVSALDNSFRTPLHWAAATGHARVVQALLKANADSASSDSSGATPLHYAAQNDFAETVEVFLSHQTVVDEPDVDGRTALMWAALKGANRVIRTWMKHTIGLQTMQTDKSGGSVLHAAALSGCVDTVRLLLDGFGADVDAVDSVRHTPLFRACDVGHTDIVQVLIENGARVDALDDEGRSPLHWAALNGHAFICQILIKYGIDPNVRDFSGRTPLHCAAYGGHVSCLSALAESGSDCNAQDNDGMCTLHWACSAGRLEAVRLLVDGFGAFPNQIEFGEERYTPLDCALVGEHHDVALYMVERGALSIAAIQDIAASKLQATWRGYRVRRAFLDRKELMMRHEQLKKDAARKRAKE